MCSHILDITSLGGHSIISGPVLNPAFIGSCTGALFAA